MLHYKLYHLSPQQTYAINRFLKSRLKFDSGKKWYWCRWNWQLNFLGWNRKRIKQTNKKMNRKSYIFFFSISKWFWFSLFCFLFLVLNIYVHVCPCTWIFHVQNEIEWKKISNPKNTYIHTHTIGQRWKGE